jgi:DNA-binding transcriptional LysR family regulator
MELRHLRYFVTVAEELHFGRAAERLFIAQPPLSQQIQQLERELGVELLARTSRRVRLTAAGQAFLPEARQILARVETAALTAQRAARGATGTLSIGFVASATYDVLPDVLRRFRVQYPDVELLLSELNAAEQAQALRDKAINIGFARPAISEVGWAVESVVQEPFVAALPAQHSLAVSKEAVPLAQLAVEPFISFPPDPKPSYADLVQALCAWAGFVPRVAQEVREMQTALSLVAAGLGIALVPASVQNLRRRGVVYRPLTDVSATTELSVVYRADDLSSVLQVFLEVIRNSKTQGDGADDYAD